VAGRADDARGRLERRRGVGLRSGRLGLDAAGLGEAALELRHPFPRLLGLLTQRGGLARLREVEQHENGQPDNRGEACIGAH
jgi:hypothetical protein